MADYQEFQRRRRAKKRQRTLHRAAIFMTGTLVVLLFAWIGVKMVSQPQVPVDDGDSSSAAIPGSTPTATSSPQDITPSPELVEGLANASWNVAGPIPQTQETMHIVAPDYRMIALPENGRVDMKYFDTVTFVGDSLTQGLNIYRTGIPGAHYAAYKSINPRAFYDGSLWLNPAGVQEQPLQSIIDSQPDNVYILLGANAIGGLSDDLLLEQYRELLHRIRDGLPDGVGIYIQSITPVRPNAKFSMERVNGLNDRLAQMAYEEGVYFIDLNEALAGDDGYLREEFDVGLDGIHLNAEGYAAWVEYLVTHTAYHPRNPYLVGSPYIPPGDDVV